MTHSRPLVSFLSLAAIGLVVGVCVYPSEAFGQGVASGEQSAADQVAVPSPSSTVDSTLLQRQEIRYDLRTIPISNTVVVRFAEPVRVMHDANALFGAEVDPRLGSLCIGRRIGNAWPVCNRKTEVKDRNGPMPAPDIQ